MRRTPDCKVLNENKCIHEQCCACCQGFDSVAYANTDPLWRSAENFYNLTFSQYERLEGKEDFSLVLDDQPKYWPDNRDSLIPIGSSFWGPVAKHMPDEKPVTQDECTEFGPLAIIGEVFSKVYARMVCAGEPCGQQVESSARGANDGLEWLQQTASLLVLPAPPQASLTLSACISPRGNKMEGRAAKAQGRSQGLAAHLAAPGTSVLSDRSNGPSSPAAPPDEPKGRPSVFTRLSHVPAPQARLLRIRWVDPASCGGIGVLDASGESDRPPGFGRSLSAGKGPTHMPNLDEAFGDRVFDGTEAPEMAQQQHQAGHHYPHPKQDMWGFGLLLFDVFKHMDQLPHDHQIAIRDGTTLLLQASCVVKPDTQNGDTR
ncbi:TPA: hypothetical protein ACH3X1_015169 [Trebouxia sp. C0004]